MVTFGLVTDDRTAELVRRTWEGEVLGEALFARLAELEPDGDRRQRLRAAEQLEAQTRIVAEGLAHRLDVELSDAAPSGEMGARVGDGLGAQPWPERMLAIAAATGNYRALYTELEERLAGAEQEAVAALLAQAEATGADGLVQLTAVLGVR